MMVKALSNQLFSQLGEFVGSHLGLQFPSERSSDLERGLHAAAGEFGFDNAEACIRWLLSAPATKSQIEILASHLTVGETYFFREKKTFEILEEHILPELIRSSRRGEQRLRLWSAACCSGEETYSLAIALRRALPDLKDWQVTILGTDINPRFLNKAAHGVFGEWSFRGTPSGFRERYFNKIDERKWAILPEIRKMVSFSPLNLVEDSYPSFLNNTNAMDVIFCRNVLIYFSPDRAANVIRNFVPCLTKGGWLALGPNEISQVDSPHLVQRRFPGVIFHQKTRISVPSVENIFRPEAGNESPYWPMVPLVEAPESGHLTTASHRFDETVQPKTPPPRKELHPARYDQALELYQSGHYAEAAALLSAALAHEPTEVRMLTLLAQALANQGQLSEARKCCDRLVAADKLNAGSHYLRANILRELNEPDEAGAAFKRALYLDQNFVLAHFALGNLARSQGQSAEADRHFANALALAHKYQMEDPLPESDGLTAGRLVEIITSLRKTETAV